MVNDCLWTHHQKTILILIVGESGAGCNNIDPCFNFEGSTRSTSLFFSFNRIVSAPIFLEETSEKQKVYSGVDKAAYCVCMQKFSASRLENLS